MTADTGSTNHDSGATSGARRELVDCLTSLVAAGLLTQTSGNVSLRVGPRQLLITPSSMSYDSIGPDDIALADLDGQIVHARHRPSSELPLHLAVYRARPDLRAIVHTHSPMATTFAVLRKPIPAVHYMLAPLHQSSVEVCPYAVFGSQDLATKVAAAFVAPAHAVLLANHGLVAGGQTLGQAASGAETVELLAGLYHRSLAVGTPQILTAAQLADVSAQIDAVSYGGRIA